MSALAASPRMVGRDAQLHALTSAIDLGAEGTPRAVFIRGEAGIGKSRLVGAGVAYALRSAATTVPIVIATGRCTDLGPIGAPFAPVRRLLHELLLGVGEEEVRTAAGNPSVVSTLSRLVPEFEQTGADSTTATGEYIAEAIELLIENLSIDRHLLLILEDLHWADTATLALLTTLVSTMRGSHVTLMATYRTDEVGAGHPLRTLLAEAERIKAVHFIELDRLASDDIADMAHWLSDVPLTQEQIEVLVSRSQGVPFFVEELVGLRDAPLPRSLRDVVLTPFERLSESTRDLLSVLAVAGIYVEHGVLTEAVPGDAGALHTGLREAIASGLVVAEADGYTFRHALIGEAIHDQMLPAERVSLHRTFAQVYQRRVDAGDGASASYAAEHWLAAREVNQAFVATLVAMHDARSRLAHEMAAHLGERVLDLWDSVPTELKEPVGTPTAVRVQIVHDYAMAGAHRATLQAADKGLALAEPLDHAGRAKLLLESTVADKEMNGSDAGYQRARRAVELLSGIHENEARPDLARACALCAKLGPPAETESFMARAMALAEESQDRHTMSVVAIARSVTTGRAGQYEDAIAMVTLAREYNTGDAHGLGICVTNLIDVYSRMGRWDDAIRLATDSYSDARERGLERSVGSWMLANLADAEVLAGHVDAGVGHARRAVQLFGLDATEWTRFALRVQAEAALWNDDLEGARGVFARHDELPPLPADEVGETLNWAAVTIDLELAAAADSRRTAASTIISVAEGPASLIVASTDVNEPEAVQRLSLSVSRLLAAASTVGVALDAGLRPALERTASAFPDEPWTRAARALTAAYLAKVDRSSGEIDAWLEASRLADERRAPVRLSHEARFQLGLALSHYGLSTEAEAAFQRVAQEAPADGALLFARWARARLRRQRAPKGAPNGPLGDLTTREHEVLTLVAAGLTNPQIGRELFIAPKTVSVHVSAILAKLGAANRAEAASLFAAVGTGQAR